MDTPTPDDKIQETDNLSEYDRNLLKAVAASNTQVIVQMKSNRIALSRLIMKGMSRLSEILLLGVVGWGGMQLYTTLDKDAQQDIASRALNQGIPVLLAVGAGKTYMGNKKDNDELDGELGQESVDIKTLLDGLVKGDQGRQDS